MSTVPSMKIKKIGVTMSYTQEQMLWEADNETRWHIKGMWGDTRYQRLGMKKVWIPTPTTSRAAFESLLRELAPIEDELYELGADREEGWYLPEGSWETTYTETKEVWLARCADLDKA